MPVVVIIKKLYKKIKDTAIVQSYTLKNIEGSLLSDLSPKRLHASSARRMHHESAI